VLHNRWFMLAVLFAVRLTMGFQFQSVAAVAPLLGRDFGVGLADIGILIGLYFTPGVALALPGGAIGQRFGDKRTVLGALLLMLSGGLAASPQAGQRTAPPTFLSPQHSKPLPASFARASQNPR